MKVGIFSVCNIEKFEIEACAAKCKASLTPSVSPRIVIIFQQCLGISNLFDMSTIKAHSFNALSCAV